MDVRTFFLDQHGCAKNQVDGELLVSHLEARGYKRAENPEDAELIIINSCGFIESAKAESLDSLMQARSSFPGKKIILAGCLAERYADVFKTELPEADGIFGNGDLSKVADVADSVLAGGRPVVKPAQSGVCCGNRSMLFSFKGSAYIKITEGCDNRCSFCAIPLIRGALRSRTDDEIVAEIKGLLEQGVKEFNLIGQDLASYGCGKSDVSASDGAGLSPLARLMRRISLLPGKFWVRLLYIHPDHFNADVLDVMRQDERFLPYFDIPFQSGSTPVIRAMNRRGSHESYVALIKSIRGAFPHSCIRTTFLTGFPGETEDDFIQTEKFLLAVQSDWSGCFTYSAEEGTPAFKMKRKVPRRTALARAEKLRSVQSHITAERLKDRVGKIYDVLVEEIVENPERGAGSDEGLAIGRAWYSAPEVDGSFVIRYDLDDERAVNAVKEGEFVRVRAVASSALDLDGELVL